MKCTKKLNDVLLCLLSGEKGFSELKIHLKFNDVTLTRQLNKLKDAGYIEKIDRKYYLREQGLDLLNELDTTTKGKMFAAFAFSDIKRIIDHLYKNNPDCFSMNAFYKTLNTRIGEIISFIALKYMEDKKPELLISLSLLPELLATIFEEKGLPYKRAIPLIADPVALKRLNTHYQKSQEITPQEYKKLLDLLDKKGGT